MKFGKVITDKENRDIQLDILKAVSSFCENNNLRYFLSDGTLIGAIRHQGYIPWDDDIDIRMPRQDYIYMIENFNDANKDSNYHLVSPMSDMAQHYMVKIFDKRTIKIEPYLNYSKGYLGIDIDVFPIEGSPNELDEFLRWGNIIRSYNRCIRYKKRDIYHGARSYITDYIRHRPHAKLAVFSSTKDIVRRVNALSANYKYGEGDFVSYIGAGDLLRFPYSCFEEYMMAEFEGAEFRIPIGYDEVLRIQYGDYLKLPPLEKQVTHHLYKIYWKEGY